jgi:predicted component of type VI protein secretion system
LTARTVVGVSAYPVTKTIGSVEPRSMRRLLQFEAAQARHLHVEQDASRLLSVREAIQQLLGRRIGFDVIARQFQPALDRCPKRSIVIYYVNKARQFPSPCRR